MITSKISKGSVISNHVKAPRLEIYILSNLNEKLDKIQSLGEKIEENDKTQP